MTKKINPFLPKSTVRFRYCDDPRCDCRSKIIADEGDMGTVREIRGRCVIVDFPNRHEGFMQWEVGFRMGTADLHLERVTTERN